ncbi:hypothetical protein Bhz54_00036 [Stenotrophomonas phage vB_SmaS_Bhz54]|jgi:hypothetical protein
MNTKPQQHQAQRIEFQEQIIRSQNWTTCLNCEYWDKKEEQCTTFAARPPLTVVVVGCPEWLGEIPF